MFKSWCLYRKAIKSLLNIVVAESRKHTSKKLILDYTFVANEASKVNDPIVQGICYLNISREHHKLGAFELALKFINQALDLMASDFGVNHFYSALAHRCHVLIDLGRFNEALFDYQKVKAASITQSVESLKVIEVMLGDSNKKVVVDHLEPTWQERLYAVKEAKSSVKLTKTESQLIELLSSGRQTKDMLIHGLYGDKIDWIAAESRFKMLLSRFRKKCPEVILFENGLYQISDENFIINGAQLEA